MLAQLIRSAFQDMLRDNFFYGKLLQKGTMAFLENEIRPCLPGDARYAGVGLHLRDAGREQYPTLSPREEDLLRRSVFATEPAVLARTSIGGPQPAALKQRWHNVEPMDQGFDGSLFTG